MAAAISSTLGSGSGVFRHGFQLNNMLGEVDIVGHEPKRPGERLASMMTPTLVVEAGRPRLVLGSAGSVRLAGAIVQVIASVVGHRLSVEDAIDRPRLHPEAGSIHLEGGWALDVGDRLEEHGHEVVRWAGRNLYFGGVEAVEVLDGGELAAAGDARRGGAGVVVGR
jgi:gamma-glutamyltranspeptidase/glutathione hydrolase